MADIKKINPISEKTKNAMLRKSAHGLPLRPSASGMKPTDIKKAFYAASLDDEDSLLAELVRVINEANEILELVEGVSFSHGEQTDNPHNVTKAQLGLGEVDNTSDQDKPVSQAQLAELNKKVAYSDVVDNLNSAETNKPLSAKQGNVIKSLVSEVDSKTEGNVKDITMDAKTGIMTITKRNGEKSTIDLPLEFLVKGGYYDSETRFLILTLENDTTIQIPVADLVNEYFADGETLTLSKNSDGQLVFGLATQIKSKINEIETGAQKNVQSDWNQKDANADDYIKNKPTIPEGAIVENNLTSESTTNSLSAKQGKILKELIDGLSGSMPTVEMNWG